MPREKKLTVKDLRNIISELSDEDTINIFHTFESSGPNVPEVSAYYFSIKKVT